MKKGRGNRFATGKRILIPAIILIITGILLTVQAFVSARHSIYEEHDAHLKDIAAAVDHNIATVLECYREDLEEIIREAAHTNAEERLLDGDNSVFLGIMERFPALQTGYAADIVITKDGTVIFAKNNAGYSRYSFPHGSGELWMPYKEETDNNCLAIRREGGNGTVYYILTDLEAFYRQVVTNSIYEDYWIVLYDKGSDLNLQNDYTQPEYKILTEEEMRSRNDGYSMVLKQRENGAIAAGSYRFVNDEGEEYENRMVVIPDALSENGIFTVGIAVYDDTIVKPTRRMAYRMALSAFAVCSAVATLIFIMLHNGKRERELAEELENLEKQNKLNERLLAQRQELSHHRKMEIVGAMTAGVAHEFNNLLSPIMADSLLIMESTDPENSDIMDNAAEIYSASLRAKELILRISKLSRKDAPKQIGRVSAAGLAANALKLAETAIPNNVTVDVHTESGAFVTGDASRLEQMLLNLIINGLQAMEPDGGRLVLQIAEDEENVFFCVSDTGPGIPEEELERIFDPFYTTKETGRGTGLGLAIVQGTAVACGGAVSVKNKPEGGACFTVSLPKARGTENGADDPEE